MGNFSRVFIAVVLIISLFTVSVFATPTGTYDLYATNGRVITGFTASGNTYISNFSSYLAHIQVYLDQILSYNANISTTIDYYLPALLQRMVDAFSPAAGDTRSMWQLSAAAVSGITAIQSAALGIAQDVYNISTYVDGIETKLDSINNHQYNIEQYNNSIQSKLSTLNQTEISSLAKLTNIDTNLQSLESINWLSNNNISIQYSIDNINYYDSFDSITRSSDFYIKIYGYNLYYSLSLISIDNLYIGNNNYYINDNDLSITFYADNTVINPDYFYNTSLNTIKLFIYPFTVRNSSAITIKLSKNNNFIIYPYTIIKYNYLSFDSFDFYTVDNFIQSHKNNNSAVLNDIKNTLIDIDNNSDFIQNNNDLQINVDIDSSVGSSVTNIIAKLQDLFDFGVGLQEFLVTLNEFDNLHWFTRLETYEQVNYDPRTNLGYQDLYD